MEKQFYPNKRSRAIDQPKSTDQTIGRRSAPRLRLAIAAGLVSLRGDRRCILIDVSRTGAQIGLKSPIDKGDDVLVEVAGLELFGKVVRCFQGLQGGFNGIEFENPIRDKEVLQIRTFSENLEGEYQRDLLAEARKFVEGY